MAPLPKGGCQTPISREAADWGIFTLHFYLFTDPYPPAPVCELGHPPLGKGGICGGNLLRFRFNHRLPKH